MIAAYLRDQEVRKVQIGTGSYELPGWLNTDAWPRTEHVVYLDITEPLPFPDACVHYIYCEQVIEHVTYGAACSFFEECRRTLVPGGKIRLATPNLMNLIRLYGQDQDPEAGRFVELAAEFSQLPRIGDSRCFVVNNHMRAWGHQFIYDPATLSATLEAIGFVEPKLQPLHESDDTNFRGLEFHGTEVGEEYNRLETMVMEARLA